MLRIMRSCRGSSGSMDGHTISGEKSVRRHCWHGMRSTRTIYMELRERLDTLEAILEANLEEEAETLSVNQSHPSLYSSSTLRSPSAF